MARADSQGGPVPRLTLRTQKRQWTTEHIRGDLSFAYQDQLVSFNHTGELFVPDKRILVERDRAAEDRAAEHLRELGLKVASYVGEEPYFETAPRALPGLVRTLSSEGWLIEAEGKVYRQPGKIDIQVKTNVDWFELHGEVRFDDQTVSLPALLAALRKGEKTVVLGDGSVGMLPEDWLKKHGFLIGLGEAGKDSIRFHKHQAGFLDVLLATQPEARFDAGFTKLRKELRSFEGIQPVDPPKSFTGELRATRRKASAGCTS